MAQDYKSTMNLPQTDFPMRAGLAKSEPLRLQKWQELDLYHKVLEQNQGHDSYILHDGPPYANGPLHMGHAFNKTLKDFIVKYKSQRGYYSPYVPGWDCHGQPIEHMVETTLGPEKMAKINQPTLRRLCREWAEKYVDIQRQGFKRLGVTGEWDDPYLTYTPAYEAGNVEIFKQMFEAGAIYRGRKPIHWCHHCHTALAEAEIEYGDETSPSIYVAFKVVPATAEDLLDSGSGAGMTASDNRSIAAALNSIDNLHILIWTTTPWTLPANTAVTLAANAEYVFLQTMGATFGDKTLLVAKELVDSVVQNTGIESYELIKDQQGEPVSVLGEDLVGLAYYHPIFGQLEGKQPLKLGTVVTGTHVELTTGTGAVHTAPGHGQEDYQMALEYDLPLLMPVDDNGVFDNGGGPFVGLGVDEANPAIIDWLSQRGVLIGQKEITHSYPHCWRCHNPVIFRATYQWFVSMDDTQLRPNALAEIGKLNWYPTWAINRMRAMIEDRPDWCISRQRSWGVPIPVYKCSKCGETVATPQTFDAVIDLFNSDGADGWFIYEPKDYLPADTHCENCGAGVKDLLPEKDILDVWWESGVSHTSVLRKRDYLRAPADLYLEGSDQHRGWFQSSLLTSVATYGVAPFKGIMSCGFIVDGDGRKMSKSLGNVIDPAKVFEEFGADVLRLWVGSIDYSQDVGIDDEIIKRTSEAYRRIRNTFRFLLSNLNDFDYRSDTVTWDQLNGFDKWALVRLQELMHTVTKAYDDFRFHVAYHAIYNYIVTDLSNIYLDALKDRLYSDAAKSVARRSAQTVLMHVLEVLVRQLAPILSFTCDEVWDFYPEGMREDDRVPAVQLAGWPEDADFQPAIPAAAAQKISDDFASVLAVREAVTKALEEARGAGIIGKSQEAALTIALPPQDAELLLSLESGLLEEVFIVAEVKVMVGQAVSRNELLDLDRTDEIYTEQSIYYYDPVVTVSKANGEKCPRCWNIRDLGKDANYPDLCERCAAVLSESQAI